MGQKHYPLVNLYIAMENQHAINGQIQLSTAIFNSYVTNYQRVTSNFWTVKIAAEISLGIPLISGKLRGAQGSDQTTTHFQQLQTTVKDIQLPGGS